MNVAVQQPNFKCRSGPVAVTPITGPGVIIRSSSPVASTFKHLGAATALVFEIFLPVQCLHAIFFTALRVTLKSAILHFKEHFL